MWFSTVVGLCLGGGQIILGSTATIIGFLVLWGLRYGERHLESYQRGVLTVTSESGNLSPQMLSALLKENHILIKSASAVYAIAEHRNKFRYEVRWLRKDEADIPEAVERLRRLPGVVECGRSSSNQSSS